MPFSNRKLDHVNAATIHGPTDQALPRQPGNPRPRAGLPLLLFRKTVEGRFARLGDKGPLNHSRAFLKPWKAKIGRLDRSGQARLKD
jgi:hypothetical protein